MATDAEREAALNAGLNGQEPPAPQEPVEPTEPVDAEPADEPVDAAEPVEPDEPVDEPIDDEQNVRQPSRAERRIQSLSEAKARAEAEAQIAREMAERYRREAEQAAALQRQREDELLDPGERRFRSLEEMARQAHMASLDSADRSAFMSKIATDPNRAKYADRVESELAKARAAGQNASREGIYVYLRGQDAIAAESKSGAARRKSVDAVRAERGKPKTPTSNANPSRTPSLEDRLKDIAL